MMEAEVGALALWWALTALSHLPFCLGLACPSPAGLLGNGPRAPPRPPRSPGQGRGCARPPSPASLWPPASGRPRLPVPHLPSQDLRGLGGSRAGCPLLLAFVYPCSPSLW